MKHLLLALTVLLSTSLYGKIYKIELEGNLNSDLAPYIYSSDTIIFEIIVDDSLGSVVPDGDDYFFENITSISFRLSDGSAGTLSGNPYTTGYFQIGNWEGPNSLTIHNDNGILPTYEWGVTPNEKPWIGQFDGDFNIKDEIYFSGSNLNGFSAITDGTLAECTNNVDLSSLIGSFSSFFIEANGPGFNGQYYGNISSTEITEVPSNSNPLNNYTLETYSSTDLENWTLIKSETIESSEDILFLKSRVVEAE